MKDELDELFDEIVREIDERIEHLDEPSLK